MMYLFIVIGFVHLKVEQYNNIEKVCKYIITKLNIYILHVHIQFIF
jgi:hypothetical protein